MLSIVITYDKLFGSDTLSKVFTNTMHTYYRTHSLALYLRCRILLLNRSSVLLSEACVATRRFNPNHLFEEFRPFKIAGVRGVHFGFRIVTGDTTNAIFIRGQIMLLMPQLFCTRL